MVKVSLNQVKVWNIGFVLVYYVWVVLESEKLGIILEQMLAKNILQSIISRFSLLSIPMLGQHHDLLQVVQRSTWILLHKHSQSVYPISLCSLLDHGLIVSRVPILLSTPVVDLVFIFSVQFLSPSE